MANIPVYVLYVNIYIHIFMYIPIHFGYISIYLCLYIYIYVSICLCLFMSISRRRQWQPTPVLLPGKSHGQRSLVGCSPWGHEESDTTERLHFHFSLSCIGEGNGNPPQCSCLENPRDSPVCSSSSSMSISMYLCL